MEYKEIYKEWSSNSYFDEETRKELLSIKDDENEIKERFYKNLEFGTAGLRGIIGAGTNRINDYTIEYKFYATRSQIDISGYAFQMTTKNKNIDIKIWKN